MTPKAPVRITHYSDILCIWAYVSEVRIEEIKKRFGPDVEFDLRFCSVFGDTANRIGKGWADRGGYEGFRDHVLDVASRFEHITVHPDIWIKVRPATSMSAHLFIKAVQLLEHAGEIGTSAGRADASVGGSAGRAAARLRRAFFVECRDVADWRVQAEVAEALGMRPSAIEEAIKTGVASAALATDYDDKERLNVDGSPTLLLNEGRQKLYGNVSFRVIEANVQELLREPAAASASWC